MFDPASQGRVNNLLNPTQGSVGVCEVAGVQNLDTSNVVAVKRSRIIRASGVACIRWISKPNSQVMQFGWNGGNPGIQHERFIAEDSSYIDSAVSARVSCEVTLIPRRGKGGIRSVDHKQGELRLRRKSKDFDM